MKHLNTYITEYIIKKKLDKPIDSEDHYKYFPKTREELIENIKELINNKIYDLNCIDTSKITDMSKLFWNKLNITNKLNINVDVSKWNVSKVTNMSYMFYECEKFDCDLSKWDVSNVTNMRCIFSGCTRFKGKGLENWDVSNVENMHYMLIGCENLICDLSNWNVSNVKDMECMFYNCKKLNFDLSKWNINNVENIKDMFTYCTSLKNKPSWYKK